MVDSILLYCSEMRDNQNLTDVDKIQFRLSLIAKENA